MNAIDRLVGYVNPAAGLRRARARAALEASRAHEGASRKDGWKPRRAGASANADHLGDAVELRHRARALVQNVSYIARALEARVSNVIGEGIVPTPTNERLAELWARWGAQADADGRLDIYGLQALVYRAVRQDGECLIRLRPRRAEDGLPVPLQLQVLEIDWLDTGKVETRGSNQIINGIEYDVLGRAVNYWLFDQHPGDVVRPRGSSRVFSRPVPAASVLHVFNPTRPGQGRGFTSFASVIARTRDFSVYEDAERARKNLEARLSVIATGDPAQLAMGDVSSNADPATAAATGVLGTLESGSIIGLPAGLNLTTVEPKAAPGFVEYSKHELHLIAAGCGVTYEMMTGDVSEVNFSSARVNLIEIRKDFDRDRWQFFVPGVCMPIWRAFIEAAALAGKARESDMAAVEWTAPRWEYVDPSAEMEADKEEIALGLCSLSEKIRQRGYKPDTVFAELAADVKRLEALGLLDVLPTWRDKAAAQPAKPAAAPARAEPLVVHVEQPAPRESGPVKREFIKDENGLTREVIETRTTRKVIERTEHGAIVHEAAA